MKKTVYRPNSLYGRMYYNRENSPGRHGVRHQKAFGILRPEPTNYCSNLLFRYRNAMEKHHHLPISFHPFSVPGTRMVIQSQDIPFVYASSGQCGKVPLPAICIIIRTLINRKSGLLAPGSMEIEERPPHGKVPFPLPYSRLQCVRRYFVTIVCLLSCRASASGSPPCLVRLQTRTSYQQPEHPYPPE